MFVGELDLAGRKQDLARDRARDGRSGGPSRRASCRCRRRPPGAGTINIAGQPREDVGPPATAQPSRPRPGTATWTCEPQLDLLAITVAGSGVLEPRFIGYDAEGRPDDQGPPGDRGRVRGDLRHRRGHRARGPAAVPADPQGRAASSRRPRSTSSSRATRPRSARSIASTAARPARADHSLQGHGHAVAVHRARNAVAKEQAMANHESRPTRSP